MFDQILSLVRDNAKDLISNNNAIPAQFKDAAVTDTATTLVDGLKEQISGGNLSDLMDLFQQGSSGGNLLSHPIVSGIVGKLTAQFTSKYGVGQSDANGIASGMVSGVMGKVISKINDPNDNTFDLQSIMSSFGGDSGLGGLLGGDSKSSGDIGGMLGKLF